MQRQGSSHIQLHWQKIKFISCSSEWVLSFLCHRGHSTKRGLRKLLEIVYPRCQYFVVLSFTRYVFLPPVSSTLFVFLLRSSWLVEPNDLIQPGINRMSPLVFCKTFCQCLLPTFQPSVLRVCILALKTLSNLSTQWKCNYFLYEGT